MIWKMGGGVDSNTINKVQMYLGATKHLNVLGRTDALLITITQCTFLYTIEVATLHYLRIVDVVDAMDHLLS